MTGEWPLYPTSSSAIDSWARCQLQWSLAHGPHRQQRRDAEQHTKRPADHMQVSRGRGRVVHEGIAAALRCAKAELDRTGAPIPGTLRRYWKPARLALGQAWDAEQMPSDPEVGQQVTDFFERALDAIEIPPPRSIYSIEARYEHVTPGGVAVTFGPDYMRWVRPGVLRIVDWKSSKVDPADVPRHPQLLRYAGWMAARDSRIRGIEIALFALREGVEHVVQADPARVARAVERFDRLAWAAATTDDPEAKIGPQCGGCHFRNICPALRARMGGTSAA